LVVVKTEKHFYLLIYVQVGTLLLSASQGDRHKKTHLSVGFALDFAGSVRGDFDFLHRLDDRASLADEGVESVPAEDRIFLTLRDEEIGKEVLLLARSRSELAGNGLLHAESRLVSTTARLMRVKIGDGRESVEESLAVVTSTTLKQLRESSDVVE